MQIKDAELHKPGKKKATDKVAVEAHEQEDDKAKGGKGGGQSSKPMPDKHASAKSGKKADESECLFTEFFISVNTYFYC